MSNNTHVQNTANAIKNLIDNSIASADFGNVSLLVTYDDDTSETLVLKGFAMYNGGSSSGGSSSSGSSGSASSSGDD